MCRMACTTILLLLLVLAAAGGSSTGEGNGGPVEDASSSTHDDKAAGGAGGEKHVPAQPTPPQAHPPTPAAIPSGAAGPVEPHGEKPKPLDHSESEDVEGECLATDEEGCSQCQWASEQGVTYSLQDISGKIISLGVQSIKGSTLQLSLCPPHLNCNGRESPTCLSVPGVKLTSTGTTISVEQIEPHIPGRGFRMVLRDGDICEVTKKPRETTVNFPCNPYAKYPPQNFRPSRATEGQKERVCQYLVEFPASQFGCPVRDGTEMAQIPQLTAVLGCVDSSPLETTEDCHYATSINLSLQGINFYQLCPQPTQPSRAFSINQCTQHMQMHYSVYVGPFRCKNPSMYSEYTLNCTIEKGAGKHLDVTVYRKADPSNQGSGQKKGSSEEKGEVVMFLERAVSFKEAINFREKFDKFVELGVGGMKKEIDELYRRAFASRGVSPEVLVSMGITHVKGILLYGPPGSGKTLLARTIASILGSKQVQLINGPEIISKYLGESERNLRAHFQQAQEAWKKYGSLSELYVIIIDEIDAICKPRGKTDQSAAGVAYDALVNQLLTLMDGLNEAHNTIVVGLTNRRELLDPALLRPGRFEVQIEVSLPDEEGRKEIFEIHTRSMRSSGMLAEDVSLARLAANTTRFSGAEIAGVVRAASSYALERYQTGDMEGSVLVTAMDFEQALRTVNPAYTHSESHVLSQYLPLGYLPCGEAHDVVIDLTLDLIHTLKHGTTTQMQTVLLYGPRGTGKTVLAAHLAVLGKFSFVKVLTAPSVVGRPTLHKVEAIHHAFTDAFSSDLGVVVLDDLHRLVEYVKVGSQITISHELLHTITTLLTSTVPAGVRVLVVGTLTVEDGSSLDESQFLGLPDLFLQHLHVPLLDSSSVLTLLSARNIHRLGGGQFALPTNLEISMRQLLHSIECACVQSSCSGKRSQPSLVQQDHLLDCIMAFVTRQMAELDGYIG